MIRNFIFFINPISGTRRKDTLEAFIRNKCKEHNFSFHIAHTNAIGDYTELPNKIVSNNITDVIICGGDGTVNKITAALLHTNVSVGILPMGSGNGLAYAAGISSNWNKAFDIIVKNKPNWIDGFFVNGHFGCMLTGVGFDAIVAHDFLHQQKRGLIKYILISIKKFWKATSFSFEVNWGHQHISTEAYFISIANSNQFGNYITIAPQAKLNDGLLDVIIVTKKNKISTLYALLQQVVAGTTAKNHEDIRSTAGIHYFQSHHVVIKNPQLAPMHIDGEPIPSCQNIEVMIQKNAFRLLQP